MDSWPPPPPSPFAELRTVDEVDAIKRRLYDLILELNTVRNTLAPINVHLPPEVLLQTFNALADLYDAGEPLMVEDYSRMCHHYKWIIVTHVCRSWRALALGNSSLWSRILFDNPVAAQTFLERAGDRSPLSFWGQPVPVKEVVNYSQRLVQVGCMNLDDEARRYLQSAYPHDPIGLPMLETLSLTIHGETVPKLSMPRLRSLYAHGPWLAVETIMRRAPALSHLEIYNRTTSHHDFMPVSQLLRLLRALPMLEVVYIVNGVAMKTRAASVDTVALPRLRQIVLRHKRGSVDATGCAYLLSQLSIPDAAEVELEGSQPPHVYHQYKEIINDLEAWTLSQYPPATPLFNRLSVLQQRMYTLDTLFQLTLSSLDRPMEQARRVKLTLVLCLASAFGGPLWGTSSERRNGDEVLCDISHMPLAAHVTHLTIEQGSSLPPLAEDVAVWRSHLAHLPLQSLTLSATATDFNQQKTVALIELMHVTVGIWLCKAMLIYLIISFLLHVSPSLPSCFIP